MKAAFTIDVEPDLKTGKFLGIDEGLPILLKLLEKHNIKATFFVTCDCLEKSPKLFLDIKERGHEIALHGYRHERFDILSQKEKKEQLKKSFFCFKKYLKTKPVGFRAPQHSITSETISLLEKNNFLYDSSKTPGNALLIRHLLKKKTNKKEVLNNFFSRLKPYNISKDLTEIPRTSFLISQGGFELKVYPDNYYKLILPLFSALRIPFIFVLHSWDMVNTPGSRTSKICKKEKFIERLDQFLEYTSKKLNYKTMNGLCLEYKRYISTYSQP